MMLSVIIPCFNERRTIRKIVEKVQAAVARDLEIVIVNDASTDGSELIVDKLRSDQVKVILMKSATKAFPVVSNVTDPATHVTYTSHYDLFTIGAGYLDVWAALNYTSVPPPGAATS